MAVEHAYIGDIFSGDGGLSYPKSFEVANGSRMVRGDCGQSGRRRGILFCGPDDLQEITNLNLGTGSRVKYFFVAYLSDSCQYQGTI